MTSPLAVVPRQVSPKNAAEVLTTLYRTRSDLRPQQAEVECLKSAVRCPLSGLGAAAIADVAAGNK